MEGKRRRNRAELAENKLILSQIYFTLLPFPFSQSKQTNRYELHLLYPYITLQKIYFQLIVPPESRLLAFLQLCEVQKT